MPMLSAQPNRNKLELEYPMRSSANILFQYISNPSGLQSWFADHVGVQGGDKYKFKWDDGTESNAVLVKAINSKYVRFKMSDAPDPDEYLEFRISQDAITGDIDLIITEFVNAGDEDNTAAIWDAAVENLKYTIGG
jgi:uncharacterized protein YndB with AHSA1/START domain